MAEPLVIPTDLHVRGNLSAQSISPTAGTVRDAGVASDADLSPSKMRHVFRGKLNQPNTAGTAERRVVHRCRGATGLIEHFCAGSIVAATGNATMTFDLQKNGVTVLSAVITLDNANTARVAELGVISVSTLVQGDVLEIVTTAAIGTGTLPTGAFAEVNVVETYN